MKENVSTEERRRIRRSKEKVFRFLEFLNLADPLGSHNIRGDVTELLIISCLQVILLDKQNEIFDYNFHGFEGKHGERRGRIRIQAALKNDNPTNDALKVYWVRRVMDRCYANTGDSKIRGITNKFEELCIEILVKILSCSTSEEMFEMLNFYSEKMAERIVVIQK